MGRWPPHQRTRTGQPGPRRGQDVITDSRERDITGAFVAFVAFSNDLASGDEIVDLLQKLTSHCDVLLDSASSGLLLADPDGVLHLVASSSERTRHVEAFPLQREE